MRFIAALIALLLASPPVRAAIAFVADGGYVGAYATSIAMAIPNSTCVNGNLMIMVATVSSTSGSLSISTPAGWTYLTDFTSNSTTSTYFSRPYVFYKYFSSDASTITVSGSNIAGSFAGIDGNVRCFSGTKSSSPINSFSTVKVASGTGAGQTVTIPALSESFVSGEMYFAASMNQETNTANGGATGFSPNVGDYYSNSGLELAYNLGDRLPGSLPGATVVTQANSVTDVNAYYAIAMTILPPTSGARQGLPLVGAGR